MHTEAVITLEKGTVVPGAIVFLSAISVNGPPFVDPRYNPVWELAPSPPNAIFEPDVAVVPKEVKFPVPFGMGVFVFATVVITPPLTVVRKTPPYPPAPVPENESVSPKKDGLLKPVKFPVPPGIGILLSATRVMIPPVSGVV